MHGGVRQYSPGTRSNPAHKAASASRLRTEAALGARSPLGLGLAARLFPTGLGSNLCRTPGPSRGRGGARERARASRSVQPFRERARDPAGLGVSGAPSRRRERLRAPAAAKSQSARCEEATTSWSAGARAANSSGWSGARLAEPGVCVQVPGHARRCQIGERSRALRGRLLAGRGRLSLGAWSEGSSSPLEATCRSRRPNRSNQVRGAGLLPGWSAEPPKNPGMGLGNWAAASASGEGALGLTSKRSFRF